MARDEYHMLHGYKLVVPDSNEEQVIFSCWQAQQKLPEGIVKCPVKIRANYQKTKDTWTISTQSFGNHLCNSTAHPAPAKRTAEIALSLVSRMQAEPENLPTGREFLENLKKEEGKTVSLKTAYRAF